MASNSMSNKSAARGMEFGVRETGGHPDARLFADHHALQRFAQTRHDAIDVHAERLVARHAVVVNGRADVVHSV